MKAFMTRTEADRKRASWELSRNPVRDRTSKHYKRINRALDQIAARIQFHLVESEFQPMKWLPSEGVITEKDDDWQIDLHSQYVVGYQCEHDGYLSDYHDPGLRATNRIVAVTWYSNPLDEGFIIKKPIYCPLPCKQWGRLPITLLQWRTIAPVLIESTMLWQWLHAVRHYTNDDSFQVGKPVGWHLETTNAVTSIQKLKDSDHNTVLDFRSEEEQLQDAYGWTGRKIYQDIIAGFSLDA